MGGGHPNEQKLIRGAIRWYESSEEASWQYASLYVGILKRIEEAGSVEERFPVEKLIGKHRYFYMGINAHYVDLSDLITTVMHEMVHVHQMLTRRLEWSQETSYRAIWKGKDYTESYYSQQPWERQAYNAESKLAKQYCAESSHTLPLTDECICV